MVSPTAATFYFCESFWSVLRSQVLETTQLGFHELNGRKSCWTWPGSAKDPSPEPSPELCWTWFGSAPKPPRPSPASSEPSPEPRWQTPAVTNSSLWTIQQPYATAMQIMQRRKGEMVLTCFTATWSSNMYNFKTCWTSDFLTSNTGSSGVL